METHTPQENGKGGHVLLVTGLAGSGKSLFYQIS